MSSYIEVAAYCGLDTKDRNKAKKFVEDFAAENEISTTEVFECYEEAENAAYRDRKLEGYYDY